MSLVTALGLRSATTLSEKLRTLLRQPDLDPIQSARAPAKAGRSRKKCSDSRKTGGSPSILERGSISSVGSSSRPQLSHWSPRAPS